VRPQRGNQRIWGQRKVESVFEMANVCWAKQNVECDSGKRERVGRIKQNRMPLFLLISP
jgi:hypothetical protein